ncbi:exodeoxyribonuclease VII large subunit [Pseudaeromonas sharmana]|uniref:Exodeoxyribonuclease 7 large subunit n=1 Tax=Pseudaeromonas sharmana TaxID=328412 RepID=A0ABV8CQL1_9GAMM
MPTSPQTIFTVSRLNSAVRILLEQEMGVVWLVGEISNLTLHSSGHWYLTLKDAGAQVRCAMFRGSNRLVSFRPQQGMQVLVQARLSLYEPRGEYQLVLESMRPAGAGMQQLQLEQLKQRLQTEGLFAAERKRPLPLMPRAIGLITSPTGAAIHDLLTVLGRRAPGIPVILYPAQVQGEQAPAHLISALACANRRQECDVLILGRGGGASEDLAAFNDEALVRAIADSSLPVVSAVGHESDVTLADFAADLRAPTPSAAAELVSPDQQGMQRQLQQLTDRLQQSWLQRQQTAGHTLRLLEMRLTHQHPQRRLEHRQQRLDELTFRLQRQPGMLLQQANQALQRLNQRLQTRDPRQGIQHAAHQLDKLEQRLLTAQQRQHARRQHHLGLALTRLDAISPLATLARGYSITQRSNGDVVTDSQQVSIGESLTTRLQHGELLVMVTERHADAGK